MASPIIPCSLVLLASTAWAATAPVEMPGCQDLKLFPRVSSCIITECSTKRSEPVKLQMTAADSQSVQGPMSAVHYSCPAAVTLDRLVAELVPTIKKAEFEVVYQDDDGDSRIVTAQKGSQWLDVDASVDDMGAVVYTLTAVEVGPPKALAGDVCSETPAFTLPEGCALTDCTSKRKDALQMRYTGSVQVDLAGASRVSGISCATAVTPAQLFDSAIAALKTSGYTQVFAEREKPEYSWLTVKQGKRWLELMSFQDADQINFQLTDVQALVDPKVR